VGKPQLFFRKHKNSDVCLFNLKAFIVHQPKFTREVVKLFKCKKVKAWSLTDLVVMTSIMTLYLKVPTLRMTKIPATHRGCRVHGIILG
jgi:hypothetical protein